MAAAAASKLGGQGIFGLLFTCLGPGYYPDTLMLHPLVSICIPTYNGAAFIEEALRSGFAQTYPNLEFLVSDDRSKDATLAIVERVAKQQGVPVKIFHHEPAGIGANWNNCVEHAQGEFIKFLFQDDILEPTCVQRMMALALTDARIGLVYCRRKILFDPSNLGDVNWVGRFGVLHKSWQNIIVSEGVLEGKDYLRDPGLMKAPYNKVGEPPAVLLRRDSFNRTGPFDLVLKQDLDLVHWYKVMRDFKVGFVDEELVTFRLHAAQATQINSALGTNPDLGLRRRMFYELFGAFLDPALHKTLRQEFMLWCRLRRKVAQWVRS